MCGTVNLITTALVHARIQYFSAGKIERALCIPEVLYDILPVFIWDIQCPVFLANSIATV